MREIARQGTGPTPRRTLWLRHVSGWQIHAATEFIVTADAQFIWSHRQTGASDGSILSGKLPKFALDTLIRRVEGLPAVVAGDDEGNVTVRWRGTSSKTQTKSLGPLSRAKVKSLLHEIKTLARRHRSL